MDVDLRRSYSFITSTSGLIGMKKYIQIQMLGDLCQDLQIQTGFLAVNQPK
jgi:hypothetical protein